MQIRFIDRGTALTILESTKDDEIVRQYTAKFYDMETTASFLVESEELYNGADYVADDMHFKISFVRGPVLYTFKGKLRCNVIRNSQRYTQIDQISEIKEGTRRAMPRYDILTRVTVYESMGTRQQGEIVDQGQTLDISLEGLCLLTNTLIPVLEKEHRYLLDFELLKGERFMLPARLVRRGNSPQSVQYKYDYGFIFDYEQMPGERSRLLTAMFMNRKESLS